MSDPERRLEEVIATYLDAVGRGDAPSREELLAQHPDLAEALGRFLDNEAWLRGVGAGEPTTLPASPVRAGDRVAYFGDYEVLKEIARGAMGVVYRARQLSLGREVALKMILAGELASEEQVRRFKSEAEAAATLDHPNIVPIYEVSEQDGQHYFSMKLIEGHSLADAIPGLMPQPRRIAEVMTKVARAVHHAHERGVLHRDLKPTNVLLDASGEPHVTDFGLAKRVGKAEATASGAIVGTPAYMAPEQARAAKGLTTAADVYGLGAVLYHGLTGRAPFGGENPLMVLQAVLTEAPTPPRAVNPKADADLAVIAMKCLSKEPGRRYASAAELADDLDRWLRGEPIVARPVTPFERAMMWVWRNPVVAGLSAACAVSLLAGTGASLAFASQAGQRARAAQLSAGEAREAKRYSDRLLYVAQISHARRYWEESRPDLLLDLLNRHRPGATAPRGFEWHYWHRVCHAAQFTFMGHPDGAWGVACSPDGSLIAVACGDGTVMVWDAASGREVRSLKGYKGFADCVAFSPDGKRIAAGVTCPDLEPMKGEEFGTPGVVSVWEVDSGRELYTLRHAERIAGLAFSPDGRWLASAQWSLVYIGRDGDLWGDIRLWDAATGRKSGEAIPLTTAVRRLAFTPDSKRVAAGGSGVAVWDVSTRKQVFAVANLSASVHAVAFEPGGKRFAAVREDGAVTIFTADGRPERVFNEGAALLGVAYSPDGKHVATAGTDRAVRVWDVGASRQRLCLRGHAAAVNGVAFCGRRLVSADADGVVKVWDPAIDPEVTTLPGHRHVTSAAFSPDGEWVASAGDGIVRVSPVARGQEGLTLKGHRCVAFSPDGRRFASIYGGAGPNEAVRPEIGVWDAATGKRLLTVAGAAKDVDRFILSPDGERFAATCQDRSVRVYHAAEGKEVLAITGLDDHVRAVAFSADGRQLATAGPGPVAKVWDAVSGEELYSLKGHTSDVWGVAFSPDGSRLATASHDRTVRVWDVPGREALFTLRGHANPVTSIAFSPDGQRLVSGSYDHTVKVWDVFSGQETLTLKGHTNSVEVVAFSPRGRRIVSACQGGAVKVWDARPPSDVMAMTRE